MGMDSVELVIAIEEEFGCAISDGDAERMVTPRVIIDWLERADREDRILHKLTPKPAPEGWWAKIGYMPPNYEIKDWWSTLSRPLPREFISEKIFEIIRDHLAVTEVWEDARFVEDLRMD